MDLNQGISCSCRFVVDSMILSASILVQCPAAFHVTVLVSHLFFVVLFVRTIDSDLKLFLFELIVLFV